MDRIPDWTIIYHDFTTYSSDDGGPEESPSKGVLAIVIRDDTVDYRVMSSGGPYYYTADGWGFYWWENDQWFAGDLFGLMQYHRDPGWHIHREGRTVTKEKWDQLWEKIRKDFGSKHTRWPNESGYKERWGK